jgi:hypothetical protein
MRVWPRALAFNAAFGANCDGRAVFEWPRVSANVMPSDPKIDVTQYYTTVIPIYNTGLSPTASFELSGGLQLTALPGWVAEQQMLENLSLHDREAVQQATHALVLTYPADALGGAVDLALNVLDGGSAQGPRVADRPRSDPAFRRVVEAALEHERQIERKQAEWLAKQQ